MKNAPKTIFVIDDNVAQGIADEFRVLFPDAQILAFPYVKDALVKMKDGPLPDLAVVDATDDKNEATLGPYTTHMLLAALKEIAPQRPLPHIIFKSADVRLGAEALQLATERMAKQGVAFEGTAGDTFDIMTARQITKGASVIAEYYKTPGFYQFMNRVYGFTFPESGGELLGLLEKDAGEKGIEPENLVKMVEVGTMTRDEALRRIAGTVLPQVEMEYRTYVHFRGLDENAHQARALSFTNATGDAVTGQAAFSAAEVEAVAKAGGKPVFIFENYAPEMVHAFRHAAAVVMLSNKAPGHIEQIMESHGIPGLVAARKDKSPAGVCSNLSAGDEVTVDPHRQKLFPARLPLREGTLGHGSSWLYAVDRWLYEWREENRVAVPTFKQNLEVLHGSRNIRALGLVRTEHLLLASPDTVADFRVVVLEKDAGALQRLEAQSTEDFIEILRHQLCTGMDLPARLRLMDAPPDEFFSPAQIKTLGRRHGAKNLRGVQLGLKLPELYEAQVRAMFQAHKILQAEWESRGYNNPPGKGLEIMVPTVRTEAEIIAVKKMVERIAKDMGFRRGDYRFGSMLETLEACKNVGAIARHCDFFSIGSNDLTSEILKCGRNDWTKRRKLTIASGRGHDPFIKLHKDVLAVIEKAVKEARKAVPGLQIDLCGRHAADLDSLIALRPLHLNGVSAAPSAWNQEALPLLYELDTFLLHQQQPAPAAKKAARPAARKKAQP